MTDTCAPNHPLGLTGDITVLKPEDVGRLPISWDARYTRDEIRSLARGEPRLSLWHRRSGGYLLGSIWRHRDEIANVIDIVGPATADDLLRAFIQRCANLGIQLAAVAEYAERRREAFYEANGMELLEDIIVYELDRISQDMMVFQGSENLAVREIDVRDELDLQMVLDLDHRAFPWLWWNSTGEFYNYADVPGVSIEVVADEAGVIVGYIGTTVLGTWGHLDRIAVEPSVQGRGIGRYLLEYAVASLGRDGVRRVALSTQASNHVSRALYESFGFRRSRSHDYRIYGRWLSGDRRRLETGEHD